MARTKFHVTPESGRISLTLSKRQLKEFKKMSIEFELSIEELLQMAIDVFISKYQRLNYDQLDKKGINAMTEIS